MIDEKMELANMLTKDKVKYKYELYCTAKKSLVDKLILWERKDDEVKERASVFFNANKRNLKLYLNGQLIHRFENRTRHILDVETGKTFISVPEMADYIGCSVSKARYDISTKFRYKWVG